MIRTIDLPPSSLALVADILRAHLPHGSRAFVFGSRATGTARRYSDLDLALQAAKPMSFDVLAALADAFSESDLPIKVDIVDLSSVSDRFRQLIEPDLLPLPL